MFWDYGLLANSIIKTRVAERYLTAQVTQVFKICFVPVKTRFIMHEMANLFRCKI